jgi:hypothetical protein
MLILPSRSVILIEGKKLDILNYLNSLCTNLIDEKKLIYTCILSPQGRFLFDFFVFQTEDSVFLDVNINFTNDLISLLNKYKMGVDISFEISRDHMVSISHQKMDGLHEDPRKSGFFYRGIVKNISSQMDGSDVYNQARIQNKLAEGWEDLEREKSIILEYGMEYAVDFNKGCYLGQELITRTKRVGEVRKGIYLLEYKGSNQLEKGIKVLDCGITLSCHNNMCLALLRHEKVLDIEKSDLWILH